MHSERWPRTRAARYLLLMLGLLPFGEIAYIAGPKALVSVAVGVIAALAAGLRILWSAELLRARDQVQSRREGTEANALDRVTSYGRRDDGAA